MKRNKRLRDYKRVSAAAKAGFGTYTKACKKLKRKERKRLRLANKEIDFD